MTTLVTPQEFAETYGYYADPWEVIQQYYAVLDYAARTNAGRQRIANRFELPEGRVREWLDDEAPAKPDALRGLERAEAKGWLPLSTASERFPAINRFVAELYARGVLAANYRPILITPDEASRTRAEARFAAVGAATTIAHDGVHHAREVRPTADGCVFGRVLACLGVPAHGDPPATLPAYLDAATDEMRAAFLAQLLDSRGLAWEWAEQYAIAMPHRPARFHERVAALARSFGPADARADSVVLDAATHDAIRGAVA